MSGLIEQIAGDILAGRCAADRGQAEEILRESRGNGIHDLLYWANRIRLARVGKEVKLCAIVPGKLGQCSEDCVYCGQSASHEASKYCQAKRASLEEITAAAEHAAEQGAACFGIVNSGRGPSDKEIERLGLAIGQIRVAGRVQTCVSLGILSDLQAKRLFELGAQRYNHNLETSRRFFPQIVSTHTYDERLATASAVKQAGMGLCCGGIFGLGETEADRLDLAQELAGLKPDSVPLNFLHPLPGTPLAEAERMKPLDILRTIAVFRFVLPDAQIKVSGGREYNLRDLQSWIFLAGASGFLIGNYLLTTGRSAKDDLQMLADLELPVAAEKIELGDAVKA